MAGCSPADEKKYISLLIQNYKHTKKENSHVTQNLQNSRNINSSNSLSGQCSHCFHRGGPDYVKLEKPIPNAQGTLIKVFSYDCPFCYKYDKQVTPKLIPKLPSDLKFRPFHLKTKGKYGVQGASCLPSCSSKIRRPDFRAGISTATSLS